MFNIIKRLTKSEMTFIILLINKFDFFIFTMIYSPQKVRGAKWNIPLKWRFIHKTEKYL